MVAASGVLTAAASTAGALAGMTGAHTASFFALDPATFSVPIEPLADLIPGVTPLRMTFDVVDQEQAIYEYDVTEHAIQGFLDITSHVHKRLEQMTIVGTLSRVIPFSPLTTSFVPGPFAITPPQPAVGIQMDIWRAKNLKRLADLGLPIMVVTPRASLARCFITSIHPGWSPKDGESLVLSVTVKEARLVSPALISAVAADFPAQAPGNNKAAGGGQSAATEVDATAVPSETPGVAPTINSGASAQP